MINIFLLKQQLTPEQNKVLEEVWDQRENTLIAYKILLNDYSRTKRNIKAIEKRLIVMIQNLPENDFTPRSIEGEIGAIENKYKVIDKAIKDYKQAMQFFNRGLNDPYLRQFNPQNQYDRPIQSLRSYLGSANSSIHHGLDAIRITKRYFKNISGTFQWYAKHQQFLKMRAARLAADKMAAESQIITPSLPTSEGEGANDC